MIDVPVTARQLGQLEVAWMLCAYPGRRKLTGAAVERWREAQKHILGFVPDGDFRPIVREVHGTGSAR